MQLADARQQTGNRPHVHMRPHLSLKSVSDRLVRDMAASNGTGSVQCAVQRKLAATMSVSCNTAVANDAAMLEPGLDA